VDFREYIQNTHTLVDVKVFWSTATVCSWADTSSIVFGRLCVGFIVSCEKYREETHYFSTQGCSAGSTACFTEFLLDGALVAKKLDAIAVERRVVSRTRDGKRVVTPRL
jgi:hypothetical protein